MYRFAQREIEAGIVSNVLVEAAGQAQSPPPLDSTRDTEPVPAPRRRSLKENKYETKVLLVPPFYYIELYSLESNLEVNKNKFVLYQ